MRIVALLWATACSASASVSATVTTPVRPDKPVVAPPDHSACRAAYAEYEVEWRAARLDDLKDAMAGYDDLIEETIRTELLTTPNRLEVKELREIFAVVEVFLWDAPWPRALKAAESAIERCGEQAIRP